MVTYPEILKKRTNQSQYKSRRSECKPMLNEFRPLKILYATHGYKPAYRLGGPILSVSGAAEELVSRGHDVVVYTSNSNLDATLDVPVDQPVLFNGIKV